jgi:DUF1365 family protein
VNNTFGQRHSYIVRAEAVGSGVRQSCKKEFYVSPFMDMDMIYEFNLGLPGENMATRINGNRLDGAPLIFASFMGARRELSDLTLLTVLVKYPFLTLGVVAAIHWEAVKLFAKGLRVRRRPSMPKATVTFAALPVGASSGTCAGGGAITVHKRDKQSA